MILGIEIENLGEIARLIRSRTWSHDVAEPLIVVLVLGLVVDVARGMNPLYVGVSADGRGGDEVCHPHGGHVLAMDMGDRGARAHGKK